MLHLAITLLLPLLPAPAPLPAAHPAAEELNEACPVSGRPVDPRQWIMSEGKRIGFCCANCPKKFIRDRENRLTVAQRKAHWKVLFNGRDLAGFQKPTRDGKWEVVDGVLVGKGGAGVLATQAKFDNFILTADVRIHDTGDRRGNSGIFLRSTGLTAYRGRWPDGLEVQVDHGDANYWTGAIWQTARAKKVSTKDGEWCTLRIQAAGPRIRVWVNNQLVTEYTQPGKIVSGPIALQVHHPTDVVEYKNLKIRPLRDA